MDMVVLSALKELSRHEYAGCVTAEKAGKRFELPFTFSDMSGIFRLGWAGGLSLAAREEIASKAEDMVLDRIVGYSI